MDFCGKIYILPFTIYHFIYCHKPKLHTLLKNLIFSDTVHIKSQEGFPTIPASPPWKPVFLVFQCHFTSPIMLVRKLELFCDTTFPLTKTWPFYPSLSNSFDFHHFSIKAPDGNTAASFYLVSEPNFNSLLNFNLTRKPAISKYNYHPALPKLSNSHCSGDQDQPAYRQQGPLLPS